MATASPRRIVRCAVMAMAVVVLLPVGYVGSAMMFCFADGAGLLPVGFYNVAFIVYDPLERYLAARHPGTDFIQELAQLARDAGGQLRN